MSEISRELEKLVAPFRRLYEKAEADEESLKERLAVAQAEKRQIAKLLREADPEFAAQLAAKAKKPKAKPRSPSMRVSDDVLAQVHEKIQAGYETVPKIHEQMPSVSDATIRNAVLTLRDGDRIRLAGKVGMANRYLPMNGAGE